MVRRAAEDDNEPFEVMAEASFPSYALIYAIDDFAEQYLQPAIDAALEHKHPLTEWREFECTSPHTDTEFCSCFDGLAGRMLRSYDVTNDVFPVRIEVRAADGATRFAEQYLRLEKRK